MPYRRVTAQDDGDGEPTDMPTDEDAVPTSRWNRRELLKLSGVGIVSAGTAPIIASSETAASEDIDTQYLTKFGTDTAPQPQTTTADGAEEL